MYYKNVNFSWKICFEALLWKHFVEGMQIKHKVLYAGRRKVLRVTSLATIESGPFIAADDPIQYYLTNAHRKTNERFLPSLARQSPHKAFYWL